MKRSPARIIELCIYILIIIAAVIWLLAKGGMYSHSPPFASPPAVTQTAPANIIPPPVVPKGEFFPGQ